VVADKEKLNLARDKFAMSMGKCDLLAFVVDLIKFVIIIVGQQD
jgi:hypothetical protein